MKWRKATRDGIGAEKSSEEMQHTKTVDRDGMNAPLWWPTELYTPAFWRLDTTTSISTPTVKREKRRGEKYIDIRRNPFFYTRPAKSGRLASTHTLSLSLSLIVHVLLDKSLPLYSQSSNHQRCSSTSLPTSVCNLSHSENKGPH